jgi:hypothetical protein
MSDRKAAQLRIPFKEPAIFADSYWIRLSQEEPENETVTFTEAAKVIDNLFDIDPCMDSNFEIGGVPIQIDEENIDAKLKESFSLIEYDPCKFISTDRDFIANIFVFRSHVEEGNYVLRLTNGEVLSTEKVTFLVDTFEEVKDEKHIPLDYSIVRDLECSEEVESYSGSTITLKEKAIGFVRVTFVTEYDKVQIKVFGKGLHEDPVGCKCIAFYKGVVSDIYISPPDVDALAVEKIGCYSDREEEEEDEEETIPLDPCYRRVIVQHKCQCSEQQEDSWDYVELIPCPPPGSMLSGNVTEESAYNFWWESRTVVLRVACGTEDDVADKEYFKEKCCKYPENMEPKVALPQCKTHKRTWFGPVGIKNGPEHYKALHGQKISFHPVRPKNSHYRGLRNFICGEVITEQQVNDRNCCDPEITPVIIYNEEDSAEIIADNYQGTIFWEGGVPPFDLKINGQGFYLNKQRTVKSLTISSPGHTYIDDVGYWSAIVYTKDSCGPAYIEITDGCTSAQGMVLSDQGRWEIQDTWSRKINHIGFDGFQCIVSGSGISRIEYDQRIGNKALLFDSRTGNIPDPSIPRDVLYHTWGGYPGGTCMCNGSPGDIMGTEPYWGLFTFKIGQWSNCRDMTTGTCAGGQICWAHMMNTPTLAVEFKC